MISRSAASPISCYLTAEPRRRPSAKSHSQYAVGNLVTAAFGTLGSFVASNSLPIDAAVHEGLSLIDLVNFGPQDVQIGHHNVKGEHHAGACILE